MDVKQALIYPYKKGHFWYSVGIPTLIYLAIMLWCFASIFIPILIAGACGLIPDKGEDPGAFPPIMIGAFILAFVPMLPVCFVLYGYYWAMVDNWQTHGLDAPPPAWKGNWKAYFVDGAHGFLALLVMYIPMILGYLTLGFLMPFVTAPFFESARERRIGAFLRCIPKSFARTASRYGAMLGGMWMCILLSIPFYVAYFLTSVTFVAPMLLAMAFCVSLSYLMTQQYGLFEGESAPTENA